MTDELTKRCPKCGRELPVSEFNKNSSKKDGLDTYCKICHRERLKEYRDKNKSKNNQYSKKYYKCVKNPSCPRVGGHGGQFEVFICETCGKEFRRGAGIVNWRYEHLGILPRFCSNECYWESLRKNHKSKYAKEIERIKKEVGE